MRTAGILCIASALAITTLVLGVFVSWWVVFGLYVMLTVLGLLSVGAEFLMEADLKRYREERRKPGRLKFSEED